MNRLLFLLAILFTSPAFAFTPWFCVGNKLKDGLYHSEGYGYECRNGATKNFCEGKEGVKVRIDGVIKRCEGGAIVNLPVDRPGLRPDPEHCMDRNCLTWSGDSGGGSSGGGGSSDGSSSGGSSSGGSSSGGSSSGGSLEIVDIGDFKPPKKQDDKKDGGKNDGGKNGKNDGGKNGQKQEGEIGPVGGWLKEPEHKAPKGKIYRVAVGCHMDKDCAYEEFSYDLNVSCSGSVSSGKYIPSGHTYSLHVRNGVCYYDVYSKGKLIEERIAKYDSISVNDVPEGKKPKDEKKKDEKPKDDKAKECLDNNPHICKGKDGKWKDTREDGKPKDQQKPEDKGVFKDKDGVYRSEDDGGEVHKDKDGTWRQREGKDGNDGQNGRDGRDAQDYSGILGTINQNVVDLIRVVSEGFGKVSDGLSGLGGGSGGGRGNGQSGLGGGSRGGGNGNGQGQKGEGQGQKGEGEGELEKYCKKHPNTLTCAEFNGNVPGEGDFSGLIPKKEVPIGWKFEDFLKGSSAKCPAPMKFSTKLGVISLSWDGFCEFLRIIRGFVIMAASVTGIMIVLKGQ